MASSCIFTAVVGLQDSDPVKFDKKNYWKYDGFVAVTPERDFVLPVFTFAGNGTPPAEDGIYFLTARTHGITGCATDLSPTYNLELYAIDVCRSFLLLIA